MNAGRDSSEAPTTTILIRLFGAVALATARGRGEVVGRRRCDAAGMPPLSGLLFVEPQQACNPLAIGLLGANGQMQHPGQVSNPLQQRDIREIAWQFAGICRSGHLGSYAESGRFWYVKNLRGKS